MSVQNGIQNGVQNVNQQPNIEMLQSVMNSHNSLPNYSRVSSQGVLHQQPCAQDSGQPPRNSKFQNPQYRGVSGIVKRGNEPKFVSCSQGQLHPNYLPRHTTLQTEKGGGAAYPHCQVDVFKPFPNGAGGDYYDNGDVFMTASNCRVADNCRESMPDYNNAQAFWGADSRVYGSTTDTHHEFLVGYAPVGCKNFVSSFGKNAATYVENADREMYDSNTYWNDVGRANYKNYQSQLQRRTPYQHQQQQQQRQQRNEHLQQIQQQQSLPHQDQQQRPNYFTSPVEELPSTCNTNTNLHTHRYVDNQNYGGIVLNSYGIVDNNSSHEQNNCDLRFNSISDQFVGEMNDFEKCGGGDIGVSEIIGYNQFSRITAGTGEPEYLSMP